jgi:DnaK suppressor protein
MKVNDLNYFRAYLLGQKSSILNKTSEFKNEQTRAYSQVAEEAEAASLDLSNSMSIQLHERDRSALFHIERALSKLEEGKFGECESCGDAIEMKRLKARPFACLCISCQEETEDPRKYLN